MEQTALPASYDLKQLKEKSNHEQELLDMQIKTFAYWKTAKKRLVDYVQACVPPTSSNYTIYTPAWLPPLYHSPLSLPLLIGPAPDVRSLTSLDRPHRAAAQAGARRGSRERVQPEQHGGADGARR